MNIYLNIVVMILMTGCAYRFSNQYKRPPSDVRSAHVEKTYDTSGQSMNHHVLTTAFENVIANDGKMALRGSKEADVYIRLHLSKVEKSQYDEGLTGIIREEKSLTVKPVDQYADLRRPIKFANKEALTIDVLVEIWDLRSNKPLFRRNFKAATNYNILDANTGHDNRFLRYTEAQARGFAALSQKIAVDALNAFYKI